MADTRVQSLFVLTLLQLCRTQAPDNLSEAWFLANAITDGYQPKPISEIFSTESPLSPTMPIVVLPKATSLPDKILSSTLLPSNSFSRDNTRTFTSSLPSTPFRPTPSPEFPQKSQSPQVEITQYTEQTQPPWQSTADLTSTSYQQTTLWQAPVQNVAQPQLSTSTTDPFVIYKNERIVDSRRDPTLQGGLFDTTGPQLPISRPPQPTSTPIRELGSTRSTTSTWPTRRPLLKGSKTRRPPTDFKRPDPLNQYSGFGTLPLKIRVVGPRGAITNVNINPKVVVAPTTTTKRPTTTRTRKTPKPKKNTYDACLNGCKARREPICAIPLSATWINPEQLKGFPSVCHMACFNSYKREPYEKVLDGRCGRLKTRIQTFDSNTKLKRDELNKAQYFFVGDDQTIVEVSPLNVNNK